MIWRIRGGTKCRAWVGVIVARIGVWRVALGVWRVAVAELTRQRLTAHALAVCLEQEYNLHGHEQRGRSPAELDHRVPMSDVPVLDLLAVSQRDHHHDQQQRDHDNRAGPRVRHETAFAVHG